MFRISESQMGAFEAVAEARILNWHEERLADRFSEPARLVGMPVHKFVREQRQLARSLGVDREEDIATFLDLGLMYGCEFVRQDWAAEVLNNPAVHGHDRIALLRLKLSEAGIQI